MKKGVEQHRHAETSRRTVAVKRRGLELGFDAVGVASLEPSAHADALDEWLAADLVGCEVSGVGKVTRVVEAPSCDLLEVGPDAVLIPFISDAIKDIDVPGRRIEVDRDFLGLGEDSAGRR